jgi:hypothetical protein
MSMVLAKNIRVFTLSRDSLTISWEIENTSEDLSGYKVYVLRSQFDAGPYEIVSPAISATASDNFNDTGVNLFSKYRMYHYRVRLSHASGDMDFGNTPPQKVLAGESPGSAILEALPDLEALEAIRRFDLTAREYIGRKVLALSRKTTGTRCSECWDKLKRRRTRSDCQTCYNTGVVGGYFYPQQAFAVKPPTNIASQLSGIFELQVHDCIMWISSMPRMKPRDLILDAENRRWRVVAVRRSEKLWALTRQTIQMREVSKDQVEYKIPISSWSVDRLSSSPLRQFIRANDIDSFRQAEQQIGKTYGSGT